MSDICSVCGLPKDICMCSTVAAEQQTIHVRAEKRGRYGNLTTIISGFDKKSVDLKVLAKKLKTKFACGGTVKDDTIELQGVHKIEAKQILIKEGFAKEQIEIK